MPPLVFFLFFCILAIVLVASALGFNFLEVQRKRQVRGMLHAVDGKIPESETTILIEEKEGESALHRITSNLGLYGSLETMIRQSGLNWGVPSLVLSIAIASAVGLLAGWELNFLLFEFLSAPVFAIAFGLVPLFYVLFKRERRFAAFEEQFPEALDFLARSMRAGHAFSVSLEMLGEESPDPLGQEFRTLFNEQNLGAPLEVAFANMIQRLPLLDVRFFVSSVMLQKQTGGNLSEILIRLAYIIRERFRLKGQVRAASAHGRLTAIILTIMPIVLMLAMFVVAPGYLQSMAKDPDGKWLIVAAIIAQGLGYFFIRRIINIKV